MKGEDLPPEHHFVRYARPGLVDRTKNTVDGVLFRRDAQKPSEDLSANWLEAFSGAREQQVDQVRKLGHLDLRANGRLPEFNVGRVVRATARLAPGLRVIEDPLDEDPSHAEIVGLPEPDSTLAPIVGDIIAKCLKCLHPAVIAEEQS